MLVVLFALSAFPEGSGCAANSDCADGLTCRSNICVVRGTGDSCRTDADCAAPLGCLSNVCTKRQSSAPEAPASELSRKPRKVKPLKMRYHDGDPVPEGAVVVTQPLTGLWVGGTVILALGWATTGLTTTYLCSAGCPSWSTGMSYVPVVGPIANAVVSNNEVLPFMLTMAAVQLAGAGMIIGGALSSRRYLIFNQEQTVLLPVLTPGGAGLVGAF